MARVPDEVALMVIRAWFETESDPPALRARLMEIDRLLEREVRSRVTVSTDVEEICGEVRRWLGTLLDSRESGPRS